MYKVSVICARQNPKYHTPELLYLQHGQRIFLNRKLNYLLNKAMILI